MSQWQPHIDELNKLVNFLRETDQNNNENNIYIQQKLESFQNIPDYNAYLVFILIKLTEDIYIRQVSGLLLKNNLLHYFETIPLSVLNYIKSCCCDAFLQPDPNLNIRSAISSVITCFIKSGNLNHWKEILECLINAMDSPNILSMEMAYDGLFKICEDSVSNLDQDIDGIRPLHIIIPKLIQSFHHPNLKIRKEAIMTINQLMTSESSSSMQPFIKIYLEGLLMLTNDSDTSIQKELCHAFTVLLEARPDKVEPFSSTILEYILYCTEHHHHKKDEQVMLQACNFWLTYMSIPSLHDHLIPYINRLIPALLSNMVYSESDIMDLIGHQDELNMNVADKDQDIRPKFYQKRQHNQKYNLNINPTDNDDDDDDIGDGNQEDDDHDDDEDDSDDDDELYLEWNLRKSSGSTLETLATSYSKQVCDDLLPYLDGILFQHDWKIRESGIFALGIIAKGTFDHMKIYLPQLLPYLQENMKHNMPLIRSITCWTISRYSDWLIEQCQFQEGKQNYFEPVLCELLERILDQSKHVQFHACSALAVLQEDAKTILIPYLNPILKNLSQAFVIYKRKNLDSLYDVLGTLADSIGSALNQQQFFTLIMPPLIEKWNQLSDIDTDLFPLFQCLSSVTAALGNSFTSYSEPVFSRCIRIISSTLYGYHYAQEQSNLPNIDFAIAGLDLLSGMIQGMGSDIAPLISSYSNPSIFDILEISLKESNLDILQSSCALCGDLSIACFDKLEPYLDNLMPLLIQQSELKGSESIPICSNAIWAIGEISILWNQQKLLNFIPSFLQHLLTILSTSSLSTCKNNQEKITLYDNVIVAFGRLGFVTPELASMHLKRYTRLWLMRANHLQYNHEKDSAFIGFCQIIKSNPEAALKEFGRFAEIVTMYQNPPNQLQIEFKQIILGYKQAMMQSQWKRILKRFHDDKQLNIFLQYSSDY
ncbi:importin beta-2 [Cunninghamella echinulata]|nr:importin beta-2 [Cunninghamella echinulata]